MSKKIGPVPPWIKRKDKNGDSCSLEVDVWSLFEEYNQWVNSYMWPHFNKICLGVIRPTVLISKQESHYTDTKYGV